MSRVILPNIELPLTAAVHLIFRSHFYDAQEAKIGKDF
jgi:hypothetical protein